MTHPRIRVPAASQPSGLAAAIQMAVRPAAPDLDTASGPSASVSEPAGRSAMATIASGYWSERRSAGAPQTRDPQASANTTGGQVGADVMAGITATFWQGRAEAKSAGRGSSIEGTTGAAGVHGTRRLSTGRAGFSIDPVRLEAFRRRKAGVAGAYNAAVEEVAKAKRAAEIARQNATARAKDASSEHFAALLRSAEAELASANGALARTNDEAQAILSVADRVERYHSAFREEEVAELQRAHEEALQAFARSAANEEDGE